MININKIRPSMAVVCLNNLPFGIVDRVEGHAEIRLKKDKYGHFHYIPLSWVIRVDDAIHINKPCDQIKREWFMEPGNAPSTPFARPAPIAKISQNGTAFGSEFYSEPSQANTMGVDRKRYYCIAR